MHKLLLIFILLFFVGCFNKQESNTIKEEEQEEYVRDLENWPFPGANGNWLPSRDGLEASDTIVDGFPYNHV